MRTKQIQINRFEILVAELPEESNFICVSNNNSVILYKINDEMYTYMYRFPQETNVWDYKGSINNISNDDIIEIVDSVIKVEEFTIYKDYSGELYACMTPLQSLHTLLKFNGVLFSNPLGKKRSDFLEEVSRLAISIKKDRESEGILSQAIKIWDEKQEKVWEISRTHLFIKRK